MTSAFISFRVETKAGKNVKKKWATISVKQDWKFQSIARDNIVKIGQDWKLGKIEKWTKIWKIDQTKIGQKLIIGQKLKIQQIEKWTKIENGTKIENWTKLKIGQKLKIQQIEKKKTGKIGQNWQMAREEKYGSEEARCDARA